MSFAPKQSLGIARPQSLRIEPITPSVVNRVTERHWFVAFAKAAFGTVRLRVQARQAGTAELHLGEKLASASSIDRNPPGCIRYRCLPIHFQAGSQTLQVEIPPDTRNTGNQAVLMPPQLFEVLPFRYLELIVADDADLELLEVVQLAVFYPFDDSAATFSCDDQRLNQVWNLCKYSIKATSFSGVYIDGDRERIAYEGDAYINQLCHYGVDAEYELARHSLEHLLFHPTWPTEWALHCVPMAWADYQYTGRTDLLAAYYQILCHKALLPLARADGLISTCTGLITPELLTDIFLERPLRDLVDWPPGSFTAGGQGERDNNEMPPINTVVNAFHAWNLQLLEQIALCLGKAEDAARWRTRAAQVVGSLQQVCFSTATGLFHDGEDSRHASLHANCFPAAFGFIPAGYENNVLAFIKSRGMACSVYAAQYLLEACYRLGAAEHALDLMTAEHDRSWLNMLRVGSTITLEAWDLRYKNNLDWNHAWGAAPANLIPRYLAGVRPAEPGFATIQIAPQPGRLQQFSAQVPTPRGPVRLQLSQAATARQFTVETPAPAILDLGGLAGCGSQLRINTQKASLQHPLVLPAGQYQCELHN